VSAERFLSVLQSEGPLCDDCVHRPAGLTRRQSANQLGRRLQATGAIARGRGTCPRCLRSKTVNCLAVGAEAVGRPPNAMSPGMRTRDDRQWPVDAARFEACVREFIDGSGTSNGRKPDCRYASFDYCFNYFQSFRDTGKTSRLSNPENIQASCLQLGFYLASWGMLRGSSHLLQRSARHLIPVIELIAASDADFWEIDANRYDGSAIRRLVGMGTEVGRAIGSSSDTLVTKVMLGVFGCVPAFDRNFKLGFEVSAFGAKALNRIADFYEDHAEQIDACHIPTVDFVTGSPTGRMYTRAKVIDMAFFMHGAT